MRSVTIKQSSRNELMDMVAYRRLLRLSWDSFNPDLYGYVQGYEPEIGDAKVKEELHELIRSELAQYIHADMIQTAIVVIYGGMGPGFPLKYLLRHLLKVAIVRGALHTARAFYECAESTHASYQTIGLLKGVHVERELQVGQGIRIIPLPHSTSDLPSYFADMTWLPYHDLLGGTLVIADNSISPIFVNPGLIKAFEEEEAFQRELVSSEYPDFDLVEFCDALSLACDSPIRCSAIWTHLADDAIFNVRFGRGRGTYKPALLHQTNSIAVSQKNVNEALSLCRTRKNLTPKTARKLRVAIDRWIKSKENSDPVDTFIDLGIALESIYLGDDKGKLGFRLRLRAAWYLGDDAGHRQLLIKEFREIYEQRSKAVHKGEIDLDNAATPSFKERAPKLCLQSIKKVMENGQFPDWNQLVLGDSDDTC